MSKTFRPWKIDQPLLLPVAVQDFVGHDAEAQVIVAHDLDARQSDQHQLTPLVDAIKANLGKKPEQVSADAGCCSDANLVALEQRGIDAYIAPGRAQARDRGRRRKRTRRCDARKNQGPRP
jgi:hypothetical protein